MTSPLRKFQSWHARARKSGAKDPDAMVLATATRGGRPSARVVLYKGVRDDAIRFFTNYGSRKAHELDRNRLATVVFYWPEEGRQVRISGRVRRTSAAESDEYWNARARESQIGAHASRQSHVMKSWAGFLRRVAQVADRFRGKPVPRPSNWGGYHLVPDTIEFWTGRTGRLHRRVLYTRVGKRWKHKELYP